MYLAGYSLCVHCGVYVSVKQRSLDVLFLGFYRVRIACVDPWVHELSEPRRWLTVKLTSLELQYYNSVPRARDSGYRGLVLLSDGTDGLWVLVLLFEGIDRPC